MSAVVLPSARLAEAARQAGFDLCGFARAEPIPNEVLSGWLSQGLAADMDWMATRALARLDVRELLPGARTVMALCCNYHFDDPSTAASPVSRYARGRDYHATLKDRVRALRRLLTAQWPGLSTYASVDTGPVMEKVWAARAGLGYVGRNGCLITEPFGSWVFLATLILEVEVDAYAQGPTPDQCGTCTLCVNSCPTEAIDEARRVDARRCLSYQTIENEGPIPEGLRPALYNLVFGCDICQAVCPLNAAPIPAGPRFAPRELGTLGVRELAALTREEHQRLVPGSPLARAKYDGLRRNAAYALGAMADLGAREILAQLLLDDSALVREAAAWSLKRLDGAAGPVR